MASNDQLNHFNQRGEVHMVDVGDKSSTQRRAIAEGSIMMQAETLQRIIQGVNKKGDVLGVARLAGISSVKKTSDLIPLAHPLAIHHASIVFESDLDSGTLTVTCCVKALEKTVSPMLFAGTRRR